ncbi:MAG: PEGA domain-containing protein [Myxococcota bacterium]
MRWVVCALVLSSIVATAAHAQTENWFILPTTVSEDAPWMMPTADQLRRELQRQGVGVWAPASAVATFEQRGSSTPASPSQSDIDSWLAQSHEALVGLASGNYGEALTDLRQAQAFIGANLEFLNRDERLAQPVVDTCLYLVRALLQTGRTSVAEAQVADCVRLSLSRAPTGQMHPPSVLELYAAAAAPGPDHMSRLLVESEPRDCEVRLNGVAIGQSPVEATNLYPGPYDVQVACEPEVAGRLHRVAVPRGPTALYVSDNFDRAVRTKPLLHLRYEEAPDLPQRIRDAREVGRVLPAAAVILASVPPGGGALELRVVTGQLGQPSFVRVPASTEGATQTAIAEAAAALLARRCIDFTVEPSMPVDCSTGSPLAAPSASNAIQRGKPGRQRPPRPMFVPGVTLASAGTATLAAGFGLLVARRSAGDDWIANLNVRSDQDLWLRLGTGVRTTAPIGSALLVAAMPLVLPYERGTPWWAWLHGALGLAAAAGAIVSGVTAAPKPPESCNISGPEPTACVDRARDIDRTVLLASTAAPLLAVPLVYLFRRADRRTVRRVTPRIVAARSHGAITFSGAF